MPQKPQNNSTEQYKRAKQRLNLPLEAGRKPTSEWVYEHRVPIFVSIIIYLSLLILFITSKIAMGYTAPRSEFMYFDAEQFEVLQAELDKAEEENKRLTSMQNGDFGRARNLASNENAAAGDGRGSAQNNQSYLRDDRGTDVQSIYDYAAEVEANLRAGSQEYGEGLARQQAMLNSRNSNSGSSGNGANSGSHGSGGESSRVVEGNVTVSYSFTSPIRSHVSLTVPAYQCRGAGHVTVNVTLNKNGEVINASVNSSVSTDDYCMTTAAVKAALSSRFNVEESAPPKQNGVINYSFVAQ